VFRPPYVSTVKPVYSTSDLRPEILPSLAAPPLKPTLEQVAKNYARVHPDHKTGYTVRHIHPADHMPDYGSSLAIQSAEAVLRLSLDDPVLDKMPALINYIQHGIDLYHITKLGRSWEADGGQGLGRSLAVLITSVVLDNTEMKEFVGNAADHIFAPSQVISLSSRADNGKSKVLYGEYSPHCSDEVYWRKIIDHNATGSKTCKDPYGYIDGGVEPGGGYDYCCVNQPMKQIAIALHIIPELMKVWNDDRVIRYADRWVHHGAWTQPDPCAPAEASMANFAITFGPDPNKPGDCIRDTDPSDGIGRFPDLHGTAKDGGHYGSNFANFMWSWYRDSTFTSPVHNRIPSNVENGQGTGISVPNPCRLPVVLGITLKARQPIQINVHDGNGRLVAEVMNRVLTAGNHQIQWDGNDRYGHCLPGGIMYLAVQTGQVRSVQRIVLLD
jgi:hypothetical protein